MARGSILSLPIAHAILASEETPVFYKPLLETIRGSESLYFFESMAPLIAGFALGFDRTSDSRLSSYRRVERDPRLNFLTLSQGLYAPGLRSQPVCRPAALEGPATGEELESSSGLSSWRPELD